MTLRSPHWRCLRSLGHELQARWFSSVPKRSTSRNPSLRTQTRPAIEFVSGEEGLRAKSYYIVFSFVEYVFADAQNYVKAPGSSCGAEGRWRDSAAGGHSPFRDPVCSQSAPCNLTVFPQKDVFNNLPVRQRFWRPELYVPSFVRGTQPGWRTSSRTSMRVY